MGRFVKGDVVVLPFPFSDLSATKRRPALVIGELDGVDLVVCQITSQQRPSNKHCIALTTRNMKCGSISKDSWIRASRIFTVDSRLITKTIGTIDDATLEAVVNEIMRIILL